MVKKRIIFIIIVIIAEAFIVFFNLQIKPSLKKTSSIESQAISPIEAGLNNNGDVLFENLKG